MSDKSRGARRPIANSAKQHRADIDGLRAVAIAGVLAYHFGLGGVSGGYGGVDVFFVISGFLIAGIIKSEIEAETFSITRFYVRRIRRIIPALTVCVLVSSLLAALLLFPSDLKSYGGSLLAAATSTSNFYFRRDTGYFDAPAISKPLLHTWSLGVEEQFYALFPILLVALFAINRKAVKFVLLAIASASFAYSVRDVGNHPQQAFFSTLGRVWELLTGALLAFEVAPRLSSKAGRELEGIVGAALIAACFFRYTNVTEFPGLTALPLCLGAALIIHSGGGTQPTLVGRALALPPVVALGLISYSVYLWHWPLMVFFRYRFPEAWTLPSQLAILTASVAIGALSWRYVEQPFRNLRTASARPVFMTAGLITAGLAVLSFTMREPRWLDHWSSEVLASTAPATVSRGAQCRPLPNPIGRPSDVCRLGPADRFIDTILWGDSHAQKLAAGLGAYGKFDGHALLVETYGGCPPLLDVQLYGRSRSVKCPAFNNAVFAKATTPGIRQVIIAARWALYAEGERGDVDGGAEVYLSNEGIEKNAPIFAAALEKTVRKLTDKGLQVTIVGPIPENVFDPELAFERFHAWKQPLPHETKLSTFLQRERNVMPVLSRIARIPNVHVVYPHLKLCDAQTCRYSENGQPLYRDTNHLNADGLAALGNFYDQLFASAPLAQR